MRQPPVGIADLAVALRALKPSQQEGLAIAEALGLEGRLNVALPAAEVSKGEERPRVAPDFGAYPKAKTPTPDYPRNSPPEHVRSSVSHARRGNMRDRPPDGSESNYPSRLTELRTTPTGEMPAYVANAEPVWFATTARSTNRPQPAVPHGQLRALVGNLVKVPAPSGPDLPRIIDQLARGHLLRVIPREIGEGTAHNIHVVIDSGGVMELFQG